MSCISTILIYQIIQSRSALKLFVISVLIDIVLSLGSIFTLVINIRWALPCQRLGLCPPESLTPVGVLWHQLMLSHKSRLYLHPFSRSFPFWTHLVSYSTKLLCCHNLFDSRWTVSLCCALRILAAKVAQSLTFSNIHAYRFQLRCSC